MEDPARGRSRSSGDRRVASPPPKAKREKVAQRTWVGPRHSGMRIAAMRASSTARQEQEKGESGTIVAPYKTRAPHPLEQE